MCKHGGALISLIFTLVLTSQASAASGADTTWCFDGGGDETFHAPTMIREFVVSETDNGTDGGGCQVTLQKPFEDGEEKGVVYASDDPSSCTDMLPEIITVQNANSSFVCSHSKGFILDEGYSYSKIMTETLGVISSYFDLVVEWNNKSSALNDFVLNDIVLLMPNYVDPSDAESHEIWIVATFAKYIDGYRWPLKFVRTFRLDGLAQVDSVDPADPNESGDLDLGQVENADCHGTGEWRVAYVDFEQQITLQYLPPYDTCGGADEREATQEAQYWIDDQGEGYWAVQEVDPSEGGEGD